jgi:hypothetical protein
LHHPGYQKSVEKSLTKKVRAWYTFHSTKIYHDKGFEGTSSGSRGFQRMGDWWKAHSTQTAKKNPKLREEIA